ncbi:MAG: hypothetical protein ABSF69_09055 [Polyangiaceae bacterium]|jgi:hypothetical protein
MSNRRSRYPEAIGALGAACALFAVSPSARSQACCAGTGAVTPGRLALHEDALLGLQTKVGDVVGSFNLAGDYVAPPARASELDFEEDLFGAVRFLGRGQVALLVPLVETWRASLGQSAFGGGFGDVNVSARYDFTIAGASLVVPGVAALAGLTLPTGKPPDASDVGPLATGATGIGAAQLNAGLAIENAFGPWLVNATAVLAVRTARTVGSGESAVHERLAPQWTLLSALAYVFPNDWAAAVSASYAGEANATIDGVEAPGTSHGLPTLSLSGVVPLSDAWRLQGALYDNMPIPDVGLNQPADAGFSITLIRSWL